MSESESTLPQKFFPDPPHGKNGWPWTEAASRLAAPPDDRRWPRVSIVTPSYNQGQFLEETIRSVLLQEYPNLEYILIDGDSTDGSIEIIQKYRFWLTYWVSEPDDGQADALQKGFAHATGEIVAYLNSDDLYLSDALATAVSVFHSNPDVALVHGACRLIDAESRVVGHMPGQTGDFMHHFLRLDNHIPQPSAFWKRETMEDVGGFDRSLHMAMDYDLWARIALHRLGIWHVPQELSAFRIHGQSKTRQHVVAFAQERQRMVEKYLSDPELAAVLAPYADRLRAASHLHLAGAHWLAGDGSLAHQQYRQAIRLAPRLVLSHRALSLLARFILRQRSFRGRPAERIA